MRYLRRAFEILAGVPDTPERTALAFSVGVFIGFSPFLGLHTLLAIGASFLFRLNRVATVLGSWSNVPWLLVPYYGFTTWLGIWLLGMPEGVSLPSVGFSEIFTAEFWIWLGRQWPLLIPAFVGSSIGAVVLAAAAYPLALALTRKLRSFRKPSPV